MNFMTVVWICVIIISLIAEAMTAGIVSIWFAPAALICIFLAECNIGIVWQLIVFAAVSALLIFLSKILLKKRLQVGKPEATNCDRLIGKEGTVLCDINNLEGTGEVKVLGQIWTARSENDSDTIKKGELVIIEKIEGVKLICKRADKSDN